jgi:hypothetical protein
MVSFSFSGGFLQIVMLIILPFINAILTLLKDTSPPSYFEFVSYSEFLEVWGYVTYGSIIAEIVYGLHPNRITPEKYLAKRGYENIVMEFGFIKTLLLITIPILGITTYLMILTDVLSLSITLKQIVIGINTFTYLVDLGGFLRIVSQIKKKEFRFYFAKACFNIVSKQEDDYKKIRYFLLGLNSYNKYLRRRLKFEINGIKKVYSKFLYADTAEKNKIINSLCESVEGNDRLRLARYLSTLSKIPETELFVGESQLQKFKTIGTFLAAAIPIIISLIGLLRG